MYKRALFVIALVAACGDDDPVRHLDGGVTIDSPIAIIDAPFAPVTLTIKVTGNPQPNIVVHFQNADSSLVATEMTDATGTASHVMAPGGYVSAIDPFKVATGIASSEIYTFAAVKPGDHLQLNDKYRGGNVSMTFTLPVQAATNVARYVVDSTCSPAESGFISQGSGSQPTGGLQFRATCTTADILVIQFDANNDAVGYFLVANQAITANGTLNYANQSYATPSTGRTYTYNNVTSGLTPITVTEHVATAKGEAGYLQNPTTGVPGTATMTLPTFTNAIGLTEGASTVSDSLHQFFDWGPLSTTAYVTDVGARKLVDVSSPTWDHASQSLTWTEGTGAAPDADYIEVFGNRNNNFGVYWSMIAPHTGASTRFPTLPVGTMDYNFDADDVVDTVALALIKVPPTGYDAVRANGFLLETVIDPGEYFDVVTSATGSASLVTWIEPLTLRGPTTRRLDALPHRFRR